MSTPGPHHRNVCVGAGSGAVRNGGSDALLSQIIGSGAFADLIRTGVMKGERL